MSTRSNRGPTTDAQNTKFDPRAVYVEAQGTKEKPRKAARRPPATRLPPHPCSRVIVDTAPTVACPGYAWEGECTGIVFNREAACLKSGILPTDGPALRRQSADRQRIGRGKSASSVCHPRRGADRLLLMHVAGIDRMGYTQTTGNMFERTGD